VSSIKELSTYTITNVFFAYAKAWQDVRVKEKDDMGELKKYKKNVPSGGMKRPASSGGDAGHIRTPPKSGMEWPVPLGTIVAQGTIGSFIKWALDDAGLLVIDGKGDMPHWSTWHEGPNPWHRMEKDETIRKVHISEEVTSIGFHAFCDCVNLTSVHIPDSVTSIGEWAFANCKSLTSIHIPDGVTTIRDGAFSGCSSLTSIHIPDSVTGIDFIAFERCDNLRQVTMPKRFDDRWFFKWYYGIPKSIVTFT